MFKRYFEEYRLDIEYHKAYNETIEYDETIQRAINTHQDIINYVQNIVMNMSDKDKKNHFFYLMQYQDGKYKEYTSWFEYINLCKEDFIKHIEDSIELDYKYALEYIDNYKLDQKNHCHKSTNLYINFFRIWLKEKFFDPNIPLSNDFYVNLHNAQPNYIIYNALDQIDEDIMKIAENKKEQIIQKIIKNIRYTPLSLKVMCWNILPIKITDTLVNKIIL